MKNEKKYLTVGELKKALMGQPKDARVAFGVWGDDTGASWYVDGDSRYQHGHVYIEEGEGRELVFRGELVVVLLAS